MTLKRLQKCFVHEKKVSRYLKLAIKFNRSYERFKGLRSFELPYAFYCLKKCSYGQKFLSRVSASILCKYLVPINFYLKKPSLKTTRIFMDEDPLRQKDYVCTDTDHAKCVTDK